MALRENLQPNAPMDECQAPVFCGLVLAILFAIRMSQNVSDFRIVLFFLETKRRIPSYAKRHHSFLFVSESSYVEFACLVSCSLFLWKVSVLLPIQ